MDWIVLIFALAACVYFGLQRYIVLGIMGLLIILMSVLHLSGPISLCLFWIIYVPCVLFYLVPPLRIHFATRPFMHWFHAQQPPISKSEREVLDAGNLWFEEEFFQGKPNWEKLMALEKPAFTQAEQSFLDNQLRTLCDMLDDWEITHQLNDLPPKVWDYIKKERFWGMVTPQSDGGLGFSPYLHSQVVTTLATKSFAAALTVMVPNSLGPAEFLQHYGTEDQKKLYLPRLARGEDIACFALTAPNAGSDATNITDQGIVCEGEFEGKQVLGIRLNFDKRYITLAPIATLIGLAFKLYDPDHLLGEEEDIGITLALVPARLPGVEQGNRHSPMDFAFLNGPVRGKDVFIPVDYIIGGVDNKGKGWRMLMECLSIGRSISLPALATGAAQLAYRTSSAYAVLREQFHRSIGQFDGVKEALAIVGGLTYACEATRWFTLQAVAQDLRPSIASAIAKYQVTEMGRLIVNAAMDIHGGRAVQNGPRNYMVNIYRAAPICVTVEGANILTRCLIIFGQGALRCHPYLQKEITAAEVGDIKTFDALWLSHLGYIARNKVVTFVQGLMGKQGGYCHQLERFSHAFALVSDTTMAMLGKQLKLKESISGRLADIFGYLYVASAVVKYHANNNDEPLFLDWVMQWLLYQIQQSFIALFANFPNRWMGKLMRWLVFPWGSSYQGPSDALSQTLADFMQHDTDFRERLTSACYIGDNADCPVGRVERAWRAVNQAKQHHDEVDEDIEALRWDALQVDEFKGV